MKRIVALILILCMLFTTACMLAGCSKKGPCEECNQVESLSKYVDSDGESHWLCSDCYRLAKMFGY